MGRPVEQQPGPVRSSKPACGAIAEHIEAGDCYQVNLTRQPRRARRADPVALWCCARRPATPRRTPSFLRVGARRVAAATPTIVSASPERFLRVDGRRGGDPADQGHRRLVPPDLRASAKDRAENVMIVDLARNDLGRVCRAGLDRGARAVRARGPPRARPPREHGARRPLRPDVGLGGLLRATFPPASITGAPKPRVMQAIEDLETVAARRVLRRVGLGRRRSRTGPIWPSRSARSPAARADHSFGVGAGITADSDPAAEWAESELKAARLLARRRRPRRTPRWSRRPRAVMKVWVNGVLDDGRRLRISPLDHGLLVGDGVFETLRVYGGDPVRVASPPRTTRRSRPRASGSSVPRSRTLRAAAEAVLDGERAARRPVAHHRHGRSSRRWARSGATPRRPSIVAASALAPRPPTADVVTVPWPRNERGAIAGLKTISYAENVRALAFAHEHGAIEAVFPNTRGDLCEATGSNVFLVFQTACLHTPPGDAGCLLGVTRALVLELAAELGIPVEEAALPLDALAPLRRGVPVVDDPRGAGDRARGRRTRCPQSAGRSPPAWPTPSPSSSPATSIRRARQDLRGPVPGGGSSGSPEGECRTVVRGASGGSGVAQVHHVAGGDHLDRPVDLDQQPARVVDVRPRRPTRAPSARSTRTRRPRVRQPRRGTAAGPRPGRTVARRSGRGTRPSRSSRGRRPPALEVARGRDALELGGEHRPVEVHADADDDRVARRPRRGSPRACASPTRRSFGHFSRGDDPRRRRDRVAPSPPPRP